MKTHQLELILENAIENREQQRQIVRIVDYLITILRIPEGNHLVMFFGSGNERSNREAINNWVTSILHEFDSDEAEMRLEKLARRAKLRVISRMDDVS